jgi:N-acetylneuraminate synthase
VKELNLRMIVTLKRLFAECPIGYSGHESSWGPTCAAVPLGATFLERHVTLDRSMWGSDQAASLDLPGLAQLIAATSKRRSATA